MSVRRGWWAWAREACWGTSIRALRRERGLSPAGGAQQAPAGGILGTQESQDLLTHYPWGASGTPRF